MTPTAQNMKIRFPAFAEVDDALIEFALEEAALVLGSWTSPARVLAQMYLAAHLLACSSATSDSDGREIISETVGRLSTTYATSGSTGTATVGQYGTTMYGARYQQLRWWGVSPFDVI